MTKDEAGNEIEVPPVTAQQILARTRERKAKSTLLMAIPDEHLARFQGIKDAKTLWAAIQTRFGDQGYDRFQRLLSLLEIHRVGVSTEAANQKFLRSLPSVCSNISLIIRNKPGIDNLDIDDMYNNLKLYEADIKGSSRSSSNSQNVAFMSVESTNITNELNVAYSVSIVTGHSSQAQGSSSYADELIFLYFANQSSSPQPDNEDLEQIYQDYLEEMDLKWQVKLFNYHRRGHCARDCRSGRNSGNWSRDAGNTGYKGRDNGERPTKEEDEKELVVQDGLGTSDWSYQVEEEVNDFVLMAFTSNT
nr:ribonuclease H-like domain-containing protein [Tanacetum cinerariifolium]